MKRIAVVLTVAFVSSFAFAGHPVVSCLFPNAAGQAIFNHCYISEGYSCEFCIDACLGTCDRLAHPGNCNWAFTEENACAVGCWEAYLYNPCGAMPSAPPALEDLHRGLITFGIDEDLIHTTFDAL